MQRRVLDGYHHQNGNTQGLSVVRCVVAWHRRVQRDAKVVPGLGPVRLWARPTHRAHPRICSMQHVIHSLEVFGLQDTCPAGNVRTHTHNKRPVCDMNDCRPDALQKGRPAPSTARRCRHPTLPKTQKCRPPSSASRQLASKQEKSAQPWEYSNRVLSLSLFNPPRAATHLGALG